MTNNASASAAASTGFPYNGGGDVVNLTAVSFVENLADSDELESALKGVDAEAIRAEWRRQHS